jgi:hypothetical protein
MVSLQDIHVMLLEFGILAIKFNYLLYGTGEQACWNFTYLVFFKVVLLM